MRSLDEAASYLEGLINVERIRDHRSVRLDLQPIRSLLASLGNPEEQLSIVHVAGSKGKGSTCFFVEGILRAAGERVGTFTSPHLERWTERFRIDGHPVEEDVLVDAVARIRPHVERLKQDPALAPSFFDATTAAAFLIFQSAGVDRVVLEVGLGGRLDSTNVVAPAVTCVTHIELEHTEILGDSLAAIAGEKAGILKAGVPCVAGWLPAEAREVVVDRARQLDAPLEEAGVDFKVVPEPPQPSGQPLPRAPRFRFWASDGFETELELRVLGQHQIHNAALALALVRRLGAYPDARLRDVAGKALASVRLPGRVEVLGRAPWTLVDEAHTQASARALREVLEGFDAAPRHLVLSVSKGKALDALLEELLPIFDRVTVTRAEPRRSLSPDELEAAVRAHGFEAVDGAESAQEALRASRAAISEGGLLCAAGSIYLAGIARRVWGASRQ